MINAGFPDRCYECFIPENFGPKPPSTYRYGDYIVLKPDVNSCDKLKTLSNNVRKILKNETSLPCSLLESYHPSKFHLTLATPLMAMSDETMENLIKVIDENGSLPVEFDCVLREQKDGGNFRFTFSNPTFAPGFDVRLNKQVNSWANHDSRASHKYLIELANHIHNFCKSNNLVNKQRNKNGECNKFYPHITLGKIKNRMACKQVHDRVNHAAKDKEDLMGIMIREVSKLFPCSKPGHNDCSNLNLRFDKIEFFRVGLHEEDRQTYLLAQKDLSANRWFMYQDFYFDSHIKVNENGNLTREASLQLNDHVEKVTNMFKKLSLLTKKDEEKSPTLLYLRKQINRNIPNNKGFDFEISKKDIRVFFYDLDDAKSVDCVGIAGPKYEVYGKHPLHLDFIEIFEVNGNTREEIDVEKVQNAIISELF